MRPETAAELQAAGMEPSAVAKVIETALAEDVGTGDVTSIATIPGTALHCSTFLTSTACESSHQASNEPGIDPKWSAAR